MVTLEEIKEILASSDSVDEFKDKIVGLTGAAELFGKAFGGASKQVAGATKSLKTLSETKTPEFFKKMQDSLISVAPKFKELNMDVGALATALLGMTGTGIKLTETFGTFKDLGSDASDATAQISDMSSKLEAMGMLKGPIKHIAAYASLGDAAKNLENQMLRNMAAGGNMRVEMGKLDGTFETIANRTMEYSRLTSEIGTATGLTARNVGEYGEVLMKVPGLMDQNVEATSAVGGSLHVLDAAIKVARGTHQDYGIVLQDVTDYTLNFGASGQSALETISKMYSATQSLGLRMQDVRSYVERSGEAFKYFGDNTSGSLEVLARFTPALKESGLGAKASAELVGQFTQGLSNMDVAQRAFLSGQTGGPGGLLGGLEIEEMLGEGEEGLGKLTDMVQETMKKQFGGKIITRAEAVEGGEGAARQFEMQRQMLTSGPFGQLAGSPEAASKLIDAMAAGDEAGVGRILKGNEALEGAVTDGTSIAKRQSTILLEQNNKLAHIANINSQMAYDISRMTIGTGKDSLDREAGLRMGEAGQEAAQREVFVQSKQKGVSAAEEMSEAAGGVAGIVEGMTKKIAGLLKPAGTPGGTAGTAAPKPTGAPGPTGAPKPAPTTPPMDQKPKPVTPPAQVAPPQAPKAAATPVPPAQPGGKPQPATAPGAAGAGANGPLGTITVIVQENKINDLIKIQLKQFSEKLRLQEVSKAYIGGQAN
jgi:hypothetical protein